jgi:translation elongation factor EF-Ts
MQKVPFQLVKQLRERVPGRSLQQCKEALANAGHDCMSFLRHREAQV